MDEVFQGDEKSKVVAAVVPGDHGIKQILKDAGFSFKDGVLEKKRLKNKRQGLKSLGPFVNVWKKKK